MQFWFDLGSLVLRRKGDWVHTKPSALTAVSSSSSISTFIPCTDSSDLMLEVAFIAFSGEIFYSYVLKQAEDQENSCSDMCEKK